MENKKMRVLISSLIAGILLSCLCYSSHSNLFIENTLCLWVLAWIYLTICLYCLTFGYCLLAAKKDGVPKMLLSKIFTVLISGILIIIFPMKYGDVLTQNYWERMMFTSNEITIVPLESVNEESTAAEIWISKVLVDYKSESVDLPSGWTVVNGSIYAADARVADTLTISVPEGSCCQIEFIKTEASGMIEYRIGNQSLNVDLYSASQESFEVEPEQIWGRVLSAPKGERMIYYCAYFLTLWLIVDAMWVCVYNRLLKRNEAIDEKVEK